MELALSPSIPEYDCSKQMLAVIAIGRFCPKRERINPLRIMIPLSWVDPDIRASRSMFITPAWPSATVAVTRAGRPKL